MRHSKPGMQKYASFFGPHPGEAPAVHLAFWTKEKATCETWLQEATDPGQQRRARKALQEAEAKLNALNA